jgi:phosphate/sulfate permease
MIMSARVAVVTGEAVTQLTSVEGLTEGTGESVTVLTLAVWLTVGVSDTVKLLTSAIGLTVVLSDEAVAATINEKGRQKLTFMSTLDHWIV